MKVATWRQTHTEGTPREDRGKDWSDANAAQGGTACVGDYQEKEEVREAPPPEPSEGVGPAHTLILDSCLQNWSLWHCVLAALENK